MRTVYLVIISLLIFATGATSGECDVDLKIRTNENFSSRADIRQFLDIAKNYGITSVELTVKMDEDDGQYTGIDSGYVFYASQIAPRATGYEDFDALQVMIDEAHAREMKVTAWIPQFHDKAAVERHPDWQMIAFDGHNLQPYLGGDQSEYFINPVHAEARAYEISIIREVARYDIDALAIDWVRFDDWHMDLSDYTRQIYIAQHGIDPISIDFGSNSAEAIQWQDFRTEVIAMHVIEASIVAKSVNPDLLFGVHALPAEMIEVAQDASRFVHALDYIAPLAYYDDWGYPQSWIWNKMLPDMATRTGNIPIYPALDNDWTVVQMRAVIRGLKQYSNVTKISWFTYERWTKRDIERVMSLGFCG